MGNANSGETGIAQVPPPWTQSLPRDVHKQKKYGAIQGTKVLPERIPGQRLKPTENGRSLQFQGTIATRRVNEASSIPQGFASPLLDRHNRSSMTALNHPPLRIPHPSPNPLPSGTYYPPHILEPIPKARFGAPPSKSFTSEPDLRVSPPPSHASLSISGNPPHTVICESPTKGKIKSKKRNKAPVPPLVKTSISLPLDYVPSPVISPENWPQFVSPQQKNCKNKPKKMGLFKKKSESRICKNEKEYVVDEMRANVERNSRPNLTKREERSTTPVPIPISSRTELKERAKSLDNLQHEITRSSPPSQALANSLYSFEVIGNRKNEDSSDGHRRSVSPENRNSKSGNIIDSDIIDRKEQKLSSNLERESKGYRRMSTVERKLYEKQLEERRSEEILSSPVGDPKRFGICQSRSSSAEYPKTSSCSSFKDHRDESPKDEWDLAEAEWNEKKNKLDELQREIMSATKKLRKASTSPERIVDIAEAVNKQIDTNLSELQVKNNFEDNIEGDEIPKTFFFGMEPEEAEKKESSPHKTVLAKLNEEEEVKISAGAVKYSRHSLKPKEKRRNLERDGWNRSLDYRDKPRNRNIEQELESSPAKPMSKKKLSREIDEFAATIEREKLKYKISADLSNSISRKGDGGYHSRQNSGSFHLEAEGSDEDNIIRMSLRPILPRRQLELPRFSPNAAWRSLGLETAGRQKEVHSDAHVNEEVCSVGEDQIHRYTRPVAPPRTSGEKSADSGISGDAGSPGPMQEFEPLTPEKIKASSGPLAVSSPVMSAKIDMKRAWTPAQDLDDNSFEEQSGKGTFHPEVSTIPKLTSRTNMFSKTVSTNSPINDNGYSPNDSVNTKENNSFSDKDSSTKSPYLPKDYPLPSKNLQRVKEVSVPPNQHNDAQNSNADNWRENWSMSRSIPNSLNNCDEPDCVSENEKPGRSRSESRMSFANPVVPENRRYSVSSKPTISAYFPPKRGHIMYLPEYKSYEVNKKAFARMRENTSSSKGDESPSTPEQERKSPSGDENPDEPENSRWNDVEDAQITNPELLTKGNGFILLNGKKNKKFSYQSTVRMMEKKKLEEKLTKEVEEKEKRRKREVEAMMKVEQEFQKKREREKKRIKKQLQIFQQQQNHPGSNHNRSLEYNTSGKEPDFLERSSPEQKPQDHFNYVGQPPPLGIPSTPPPFKGHRQMTSYQSLPMEFVNNQPCYESTPFHEKGPQQRHSGLFGGIKKWVSSKKDQRSGYVSDASSATVTSVSRQDPDGAPASSPGRKNHENIRAEIIAASRHRDGNTIPLEGELMAQSMPRRSKSPALSVASKETRIRTATPDSRRAISPDSRRSISSEICPLTRELPEMKQEHRQYKEYRRSARKQLIPPHTGSSKQNYKESPVTYNYRRDFCLGHALSPPHVRLHPSEESDRYSRHSNESRRSKRSNSTEPVAEPDFAVTDLLRRRFSSPQNMKSVPISIPPNYRNPNFEGSYPNGKRISKGYHQPHLPPYSHTKGYQHGKIVTVT